jgi:small-conductance mechanosensitive channel
MQVEVLMNVLNDMLGECTPEILRRLRQSLSDVNKELETAERDQAAERAKLSDVEVALEEIDGLSEFSFLRYLLISRRSTIKSRLDLDGRAQKLVNKKNRIEAELHDKEELAKAVDKFVEMMNVR